MRRNDQRASVTSGACCYEFNDYFTIYIEIVGLAPAATAMVSKHLTSSLSDESFERSERKELTKSETPEDTVLRTSV